MHAVMLGVSENYFGALAVELGHGARNQALLATLPILSGAMSQLLAPTFTRFLGSRKRLVLMCASLQALTHLWFIQIAETETRALAPFLAAKVLYFIGGSMSAPAWSAWMATLTMGPGRERYFALRSGAIQVALLLAFMAGARSLDGLSGRSALLDTYAQLFWVGLSARSLSSMFLALQHDPERAPVVKQRLRILETFERADFRVALYMATLHFGTYIASPFFVSYWLDELRLGYHQYAILVGTSVLVKALSLPTLHHVSARYGMDRLLYASGFCAALLPLWWALSSSFGMFIAIQVASGITWGAIEYASFQLLLRSSSDETRLEFLSIAGTLTGLGQLTGSLVGSVLLDQLGLSYLVVFAISSAARGMPLVLSASLGRVARRLRSSPR